MFQFWHNPTDLKPIPKWSSRSIEYNFDAIWVRSRVFPRDFMWFWRLNLALFYFIFQASCLFGQKFYFFLVWRILPLATCKQMKKGSSELQMDAERYLFVPISNFLLLIYKLLIFSNMRPNGSHVRVISNLYKSKITCFWLVSAHHKQFENWFCKAIAYQFQLNLFLFWVSNWFVSTWKPV